MTIRALVSADRPVVRLWPPDNPKIYVEIHTFNTGGGKVVGLDGAPPPKRVVINVAARATARRLSSHAQRLDHRHVAIADAVEDIS